MSTHQKRPQSAQSSAIKADEEAPTAVSSPPPNQKNVARRLAFEQSPPLSQLKQQAEETVAPNPLDKLQKVEFEVRQRRQPPSLNSESERASGGNHTAA